MRKCVWCETDISGPGEAFPVMFARWGGPEDNWQCSPDVDGSGCKRRQDRLLVQAGGDPAKFGREPIARLIP